MTSSVDKLVSPRSWTIALWLAQIALAVVYVMAGSMKLTQPMDVLAASGMAYVLALPAPFIRFVGLMEILGAIGLIAPSITRVRPFLAVWAAAGLSFLQVSAMILHISRGEFFILPANAVLLAIALFILWGRSRKAPIAAR